MQTGPRYERQPLRMAQMKRGWTNQELARRSGVSDMTITRVMRGDPISPKTMKKIADALNVDLGDLVTC